VAVQHCPATRTRELALRSGDLLEIVDRDGRFVKGRPVWHDFLVVTFCGLSASALVLLL
jgi:hypothetical protein